MRNRGVKNIWAQNYVGVDTYSGLGADYFERLESTQIERYHVRRLEQLGYTVTLAPASAA